MEGAYLFPEVYEILKKEKINRMKKENKTAVGYCCVKIGEQNEQSIEQQKNLISQYAEAYGYKSNYKHIL